MPHLILEYTRNLAPVLDVGSTLRKLNHELDSIGEFVTVDIKSRAVPLDTFVVGVTPEEQAFVHVQLAILAGRSPSLKRQVSERLLRVLRSQLTGSLQLRMQVTVQIRDIDPDGYSKAIGWPEKD